MWEGSLEMNQHCLLLPESGAGQGKNWQTPTGGRERRAQRPACNDMSQPPGGINKTGKAQEPLVGNLWHLELGRRDGRKVGTQLPSLGMGTVTARMCPLPACVLASLPSWRSGECRVRLDSRGRSIQPSCSARRGRELL